MDTNTIRSDFDRLAALDNDDWDHNRHYHDFLIKQLPRACQEALEIGCGAGSFSRRLSKRAHRVLALDLSPEMIKAAKRRSDAYTNIEYQVADVLTWDFPKNKFDCIASIATLHHLPLESILGKMKTALKTNGVLLALDLYAPEGPSDRIREILAVPLHTILKIKNTGRLKEPGEIRSAWAQHGARDSYLPVAEVRRKCNQKMPGAIVKKHLLWRYSIVWRKEA
jgi:ubiquinone/menaquinone biosynthesis C-methylase UbiE